MAQEIKPRVRTEMPGLPVVQRDDELRGGLRCATPG